MARKYAADAAVSGKMAGTDRKAQLEKEFGRSVGDFGGIVHDLGVYGYAELMLAFGMSRESARALIQKVSEHPATNGRFQLTRSEGFVFGRDLRIYLEAISERPTVAPNKTGEKGDTGGNHHGRRNTSGGTL